MTAKLELSFLQKVPLLAGLSKTDLKKILKETHMETFDAGAVIVKEGDAGGRMFLIVEGLAKVTVEGEARKALGPGDFFGEISLLDQGPRSATVTAETKVKALSLTSWNFLAQLQEHWTMASAVLKNLAALVRDVDSSARR